MDKKNGDILQIEEEGYKAPRDQDGEQDGEVLKIDRKAVN